jgi:hypothetical protein
MTTPRQRARSRKQDRQYWAHRALMIEQAIPHLRAARNLLRKVDAVQSAAKAHSACKSAEGALRHAERFKR